MLRQIVQGKPAVRGRYVKLQPTRAAVFGAAESMSRQSNSAADLLQAGSAWDIFDITAMAYDHNFDDSAALFDTKSDHLSPGL